MHYSLLCVFLASVSATPLYLLPPGYQYALFGVCAQVCVSPPCTCTQPVVISLPEEGETSYECKEAGAFPNRENECKSYFVCIEQGNTGTFSVRQDLHLTFSYQRYCRSLRDSVIPPLHSMSTLEFVTGNS